MCSEKAVAYNASTAAGFAGALVRAHCLGQDYPSRIMFDHESFIPLIRRK
jgi:hypothetical protein